MKGKNNRPTIDGPRTSRKTLKPYYYVVNMYFRILFRSSYFHKIFQYFQFGATMNLSTVAFPFAAKHGTLYTVQISPKVCEESMFA